MGRSLERRRLEFLATLRNCRRVLILGEGDGRFLSKFLEINPTAQVDCVDSSEKMLAVTRTRIATSAKAVRAGLERITFHHADANTWLPATGRGYDLVVSHFFLDCFGDDELVALVGKFAGVTAPKAQWVVSEFHQPDSGWKAWRAKLWIGGLYRLFGWTTGLRVRRLPMYRSILEQAGFGLVEEVTANAGLLVSERWIKGPGSNAVDLTATPPPSRELPAG